MTTSRLHSHLQSADQNQHKGLEGKLEDTESSITVLSQQSLLSLDAARLVVHSTEEKARKEADLETMSQPFNPQSLESDREEWISGMEQKDHNCIWLSTRADLHLKPPAFWNEQ